MSQRSKEFRQAVIKASPLKIVQQYLTWAMMKLLEEKYKGQKVKEVIIRFNLETGTASTSKVIEGRKR